MKNHFKKSLSFLLAVIMMMCVVPLSGESSVTVKAASSVQSKLDNVISSYPPGSRWTGIFDGGEQCYGFAKLVVYNLFGKNSSGGYRSWNYAGVSTSGMKTLGSVTSYSSTNVRNLLSSAKCGDVLQFNTAKQHSMIVYSVDSNGVTVYDCNWDNKCGIRKAYVGFGAWSGRNSSKLTLLRSDNYPSDTIVHTVNSNYGKNFTSYPKAKITAGNIFDANHNQISSTAWIGTSDKCTIHEVYTDGCCKVSYPLDSGGSKTVYSKISLFNVHAHSYKENYEAAHPHRKYMKCSCGDWYYTGKDAATYDSGKITTAATCKSTGVKTFTCTICKATKTETVAKNASNHIGGTAVENAKAATCTAKGYTGDTYCLGCGVVTAKGKDIAIKAHTESKWIIDKNASCAAVGSRHTECTVCHAKLKTETIPVKGHSYADVIIRPTCVKDGSITAKCSVCGYIQSTEVVPAIGHTDKNNDGKCDECGTKLSENETGNENKCSCICHKSGVSAFIYKIIKIFWKLFGTKKVCACGKAHY